MRQPGRRALLALAIVVAAARPAGAVVLKTITVDGNVAEWSDVLADPAQFATDGTPDLDAPVPSTGRDLTGFAWTYDAGYLYFYTARVASDANRQRFWFYLDTDDSQTMQTGEPVVLVSWFGSTRRTDIELWRYRAVAPGGDPLGNPSADGWDMPGTVSLVRSLESLNGGAPDGVRMEARVRWTDIATSVGQPIRFHVSSSNATNLPSAVHDNLGGPGGAVGYIRFSDVRLEPDRSGTIVPAGVSVLAHVATNLGTAPDTLDLSWSAAGAGFVSGVAFHADLDADGVLDPGEPAVTDTGVLPANGSVALLAVVSASASAADGQVATVTLVARSRAVPTESDPAVDTVAVAIPAVTLLKSADRAIAVPGEVVTYTVTYTSTGTVPAHQVVVVDAVPPETAYVAGSAAGAGTSIAWSHDGGATFDASQAAPVTHVRWSLAAPLSPGGSGSVTFQAAVR